MQDLDLDKYAEIHYEKTGMNIKEVLESIVSELTSPYQLAEKKLNDLTPEDLFYLCTGENKNTLRKGSVLQVQVNTFDEAKQILKCRLECGLEGIVDSKMIPEKKSENPKFVKRQVITTRVVEITPKVQNKDIFFRIRLSLLPDDIIHHGKFIQLALDDAFVMEDADWIEKAVMEDEYKTGQKYVPRVVNHPKFKNIGLRTACDELFNKDIGECLFRPSSRGQDHLTCTWKFYDFIYSHLDIIEEGKPALNMLGTKFRISTEVFESLQEIIDRYVCPCAELTKEAISHPKFKDSISGGSKLIENLLIQEKRSRPTNIPYYFTIRQEYPQYMVLYYLPKEEITVEYIKVKPKGFFFHEAYHPNINFLISWFKRHYSDRTYKSQLTRSKTPVIDTSNHLSIPGKLQNEDFKTSEPQSDSQDKPQTPRNLPESTPYNKTPHIGYQEWAGGKDLTKTPRADDWEMSRNYDSWTGNKTPGTENEKNNEQNKNAETSWGNSDSSWGTGDSNGAGNSGNSGNSWGAENSAWGNSAVPDVPKTNWDEEKPRGRGDRGSRGGRGCRKCGVEGHFAKDCTSEKKDTCFKCGQSGHMSRECTSEKKDTCFKCDSQDI
jgi:transcription elongation factor SPT6